MTPQDFRHFHRVLDLEPGAPVESIRGAFRRLVNLWHPDRFQGDPEKDQEANERLKQIIPAYQKLVAFYNGTPMGFEAAGQGFDPRTTAPPKPKDAFSCFDEGNRQRDLGNYEMAASCFREAAQQGHMEAQFELGSMLDDGLCVDWSQADAAHRYRKARSSEAVDWYLKAAEQGHVEAQYRLGQKREYYPPLDYPEALRWYRKAAEQGHARAQLALGRLYIRGRIRQDYNEAAKWFREAVAHGLVEANFELGQLYEWGRPGTEGFRQDCAEAAFWYRKGAEGGDEDAQYWLGRLYEEGRGVPMDSKEADHWLRKSGWAERHKRWTDAPTRLILAQMYETGVGADADIAKAIKCYRVAAIWGIPKAQLRLGQLYWAGTGTPSSLVEAYKWFAICKANDLLVSVAREMTPAEIEKAKRLASRFLPGMHTLTKTQRYEVNDK